MKRNIVSVLLYYVDPPLLLHPRGPGPANPIVQHNTLLPRGSARLVDTLPKKQLKSACCTICSRSSPPRNACCETYKANVHVLTERVCRDVPTARASDLAILDKKGTHGGKKKKIIEDSYEKVALVLWRPSVLGYVSSHRSQCHLLVKHAQRTDSGDGELGQRQKKIAAQRSAANGKRQTHRGDSWLWGYFLQYIASCCTGAKYKI